MVDTLSFLVIGPDAERRQQVVAALHAENVFVARELALYPRLRHAGEEPSASEFDVVVIDLDSDQEAALELVSQICSRDASATVIVYSVSRDPEVVVRCMRAGAREFLAMPVSKPHLAEALARVAERHADSSEKPKADGKILVFWGAKGGVGVTTLATNFAVALRAEAGSRVALVDLNLQLGDVAMVLGVEPQFTVADALRSSNRLDNEFLSALLVDHESGIAVLAGPDQFTTQPLVQNGNLSRVLHVLCEKFSYIVVDAGPALGPGVAESLAKADRLYVVTEADIPTLRNTQRFVAHLLGQNGNQPQLELILNRYRARTAIDEAHVVKALGRAVDWKVPNDYQHVQESLNTGMPLAPGDSTVARVLRQMARVACGKPLETAKARRWSLRLG